MANPIGVPLPTLRRLPLYYRVFKEKKAESLDWLSSDALGRILGFGAIQVRKDLGAVGASGSPKRGYPVDGTIAVLEGFLGLNDYRDVFLLGSGIQGEAVLADRGLERHGFQVVAVFDSAPDRIGREVAGKAVLDLERLPDLARRMGVKIAVLAVGPDEAGPAAETLRRAGIGAVLDLTGAAVSFPAGMLVARENIGTRLAALAGELKGRSV